MKNNPLSNASLEFDKYPNEMAGIIQAHEFIMHSAVAGTSRALFPMVDHEMRRMMQDEANKPVNPAPEITYPAARPTATEMLAQVATSQTDMPTNPPAENILTESADPEDLASQQRRAIDAIHAEIAAERLNQGDFDRAA